MMAMKMRWMTTSSEMISLHYRENVRCAKNSFPRKDTAGDIYCVWDVMRCENCACFCAASATTAVNIDCVASFQSRDMIGNVIKGDISDSGNMSLTIFFWCAHVDAYNMRIVF